jgi:hypothetical protein
MYAALRYRAEAAATSGATVIPVASAADHDVDAVDQDRDSD